MHYVSLRNAHTFSMYTHYTYNQLAWRSQLVLSQSVAACFPAWFLALSGPPLFMIPWHAGPGTRAVGWQTLVVLILRVVHPFTSPQDAPHWHTR